MQYQPYVCQTIELNWHKMPLSGLVPPAPIGELSLERSNAVSEL